MFILIFVVAFIVNVVISHLIGKSGEDRKIGYRTAFLVSFLLSPIIGLLLVISSKYLMEEEIKNKEEGIKYENIHIKTTKKEIDFEFVTLLIISMVSISFVVWCSLRYNEII